MNSLAVFFRLVIATVLLYSAMIHEANPYHFITVISRYSVTDNCMVIACVAMILTALHIVLGTMLLFNIKSLQSLMLSALLMSFYTAMQARTLILDLNIPCGCLSHSDRAETSIATLFLPIGVLVTTIIDLVLTLRNSRMRTV